MTDKQKLKYKKMELTAEQKRDWENWLSKRPKNIRKVAEQILPWKKYRDIRIDKDIGNRYRPISYQETEDGRVTITCEKSNKLMPFLGGYGVYGMSADNLEEAD